MPLWELTSAEECHISQGHIPLNSVMESARASSQEPMVKVSGIL